MMMISSPPTTVNLKLQLRRPGANATDEFFRAKLHSAEEGINGFSLPTLRELLSEVIPVTASRNYRLLWVDADGDEVTISNDEALNLAIEEMDGPVYKIVIALMKQGQGPPGPRESGDVHPGVSCDNCEKEISGFRYKCVVCPDFDLCARCESKGLHQEHNMIRMASPTAAYPRHFFRRIGKLHEKMAANKDKRSALKEHKEVHEAAHQAACESAVGLKSAVSGSDQQNSSSSTTTTVTTKSSKDDCSSDDDEEEEEEEPSLDEVIAQLSTHGADYLRNLGSMISTTLDNIMVEEEEEGEKEKPDPDTKLETALAKMTDMGYTNENDWLKKLLLTVDCDVTKAVATLEPPAAPVDGQKKID